jgi:acetyl esterase/lipase
MRGEGAMIDWTDAFDNSSYVPGSKDLIPIWTEAAANARTALPEAQIETDIPYGATEREKLDLFLPDTTPRGLIVFVHGGYWQMNDKSMWSHLAAGPLAHGWAVAMPSYTLAPEAEIATITRQIAAAIGVAAGRVDGPVRLIGHSAGGHLVSRMVCDPSPLDLETLARIDAVTSLSGIHDLRPLTMAAMNENLRLTDKSAAAASPVLYEPQKHIPVRFWVGAAERPELIRQTRLIAEAWALKGGKVSDTYEPSHNHFTVVAALEDPQSPLTTHLCAP